MELRARDRQSIVRLVALGCVLLSGSWRRRPSSLPTPLALPTAIAPRHDSLVIRSSVLGEARLINVHTPAGYETSSARFPVLYMPDGGLDEDFPHVVHAVDSLTAAGVVRPHIVVGIPNTERRRDLTGPTRVAADSAIAPHVGGSAAFRRFLRDELIPTIDARYRTTAERSIIGESLAGLFIVETCLREPRLFQHYVAFDPSLWWNHGSLVDSAVRLLTAAPPNDRRLTLYLASSRDDIDNQTTRLATALRAASPQNFVLAYERRPDLSHATIFRALEGTGLVAALR